MATVILARHGRTVANATGVLAGRTPGVVLDDVGVQQAEEAARRLDGLALAAAVTSPLERCKQTATILLRGTGGKSRMERNPTECDYGDWRGRPMKELVKEDLWKVVQAHPAGVQFPGGEAMAEMSARAIKAVRSWDARVGAASGDDSVWLAVAHGDVIKAVLADALGVHLDAFQRIVVDPASLSVISYTDTRPFVVRMNDTGGDVVALLPPKKKPRRSKAASDAAVGGGAGPGV